MNRRSSYLSHDLGRPNWLCLRAIVFIKGIEMKSLELKIPPVFLVLVAFGLMRVLANMTPSVDVSELVRSYLFLMFMLVGGVFAIAGVVVFKKARTTVNPTQPSNSSSLVTSGVYRLTRNPMYLGFVLFLLGWGFYLANAVSLVVIVGFMAYMSKFQIQPEERALEQTFGDAFVSYKQSVRRWL